MEAIIVADLNEIYALENYGWQLVKKEEHSNRIFYFYKNNNKQIIIVHSGIGIVNAAAVTQILITQFSVTKIFNYGAVGSSSKLKIYDLVIPEKIYFFDVQTPWYPFGQTPHEAPFFINSLNSQGNKKNNLASGNSFLNNKQQIVSIQQNIDVDIFDMEAAAIAQICQQNQVKLFIIKVVSDIIGLDGTSLENINSRIAKAGKKALEHLVKYL